MTQTSTIEPRNSLLLVPTSNPVETLQRTLDREFSLDGWNVLLIAYGHHHRSLGAKWHDRIDETPANFGTITVGDVSDGRRAAPVSRGGRDVTTTIPNPADLGELGTTISLYLDDWSTRRTLVCFHAIDDLLAHVETETAFRFLHVLTRRLAEADALGQFSLDSASVEESTVRTLEPLFDSVDELDAEEPSISPDVAFDVLRAPRRRFVLHYLRERTGRTTVTSLAEWIARHEPDADPERVEVSLFHSHLPKLEDAGVIAVDRPDVTATPTIEVFSPYLDLVSDDDLPE